MNSCDSPPIQPLDATSVDEVVDLFANAVGAATRVVSFTHISNVTGFRLPANEICAAIRRRNPDVHIHVDGAHADLLNTEVGVSKGFEAEKGGGVKVKMRGNEVFKVAVRTLGQIADETLAANGMDKADLDWLVPHQANIRIIQATARKLRMNMDHVVVTVDEHGNTSAASVPLALDTAVRDGRIQRGETLLLEAFGGGFTWGSVLLKY